MQQTLMQIVCSRISSTEIKTIFSRFRKELQLDHLGEHQPAAGGRLRQVHESHRRWTQRTQK